MTTESHLSGVFAPCAYPSESHLYGVFAPCVTMTTESHLSIIQYNVQLDFQYQLLQGQTLWLSWIWTPLPSHLRGWMLTSQHRLEAQASALAAPLHRHLHILVTHWLDPGTPLSPCTTTSLAPSTPGMVRTLALQSLDSFDA